MYLNTVELDKMKKQYEIYTQKRQELQEVAGKILNLSKKLIYAIHREDKEAIKKIKQQLLAKVATLRKLTRLNPNLMQEGIYSNAMQEYCEALCFLNFVNEKKIPAPSKLGVTSEDYLLALSDLTGELERRAVYFAIKRNFFEIKKIHEALSEIYAFFLEFNLRNSELRKKADAIKWNLKRIEEIIFEARNDENIRA